MPPPFLVSILALLIPLIALLGRMVIGPWIALQHRRLDIEQSSANRTDAVRAQDEIRQLRDRIAVLERVVTDNTRSIDLDREIERLRDR